MNSIVLSGRLTKKPELRATTNSSVCHFSLAVNKYASDEVDFIECVCFGKIAENLVKYQDKGSMIELNGKIQNNKYTDKDGKNVSKTVIVAETINYISLSQKHSSEAKNGQKDAYEEMGRKIEHDNLPF